MMTYKTCYFQECQGLVGIHRYSTFLSSVLRILVTKRLEEVELGLPRDENLERWHILEAWDKKDCEETTVTACDSIVRIRGRPQCGGRRDVLPGQLCSSV
jgi:hypothetical protein